MAIKSSGLMLVHHVADELSCSVQHVRDLIKTGELEAVRLGRRKFGVKKESVIRFLEERRVKPEIFLN